MAQATGRIVPGDESEVHDEPHIEGRRITVRQIAELVEDQRLDPGIVADRYDLALADVYRALTYYHDNPDEMERVEERRQKREQVARDTGAETLDDVHDRSE